MSKDCRVAGIVLAAGMSQRMGTPKMALPWKGGTVLGTVIKSIYEAGITDLFVVTGGNREIGEGIVDNLPFHVNKLFNSSFSNGEMVDSIKVGLSRIDRRFNAALISLGDQPQIKTELVAMLLERYELKGSKLIVPSYLMQRGHPWLIDHSLWEEILNLSGGHTMRNFFAKHAGEIDYLTVDGPEVLADLDTPEDYRRAIEK